MSNEAVDRLLTVFDEDEASPSAIVRVYEKIFGGLPRGSIVRPSCQEDDRVNIQLILAELESEHLKMDLSHISAAEIALGNPRPIMHVLEILAGYTEHILEKGNVTQDESWQDSTFEDKENVTFDISTRELIETSPVKSILSVDCINSSAFKAGYQEGVQSDSLIERLDSLPNIADALKHSHGLDMSEYKIDDGVATSTPCHSRRHEEETEKLIRRMEEREAAAVGTPEPAVRTPPETPDQVLDRSIKERILFLLENSGNKPKKTRQVRFKLSPRSSTNNSSTTREDNTPSPTTPTPDPDLRETLDEMVSMGMSPSTARTLWGKQMRQVAALNKADDSRALLLKKHLKEEEKRQELLLQMMQKELEFVARKGAEEEVKREERLLKAKMFEKKLTAVRVRKHYGDYCVRMKSRMVNKSAREEQIFIKQFEKGLKLQKERMLQSKKEEKQRQEEKERKYRNEIKKIEQLYRDQVDLMQDKLDKERGEKMTWTEERAKQVKRYKAKKRAAMKRTIEALQKELVISEDSLHFKKQDIENLC